MSYSIVGNTGAKLQKRETQFDPEAGYTDIEIWTGPKEAIQGKFNLMSGAGWRCVMSHTGPCWTMTAQIGGTGAIEVWELASEWAVIDIRQSPYLGTLAVDFITLNLWFESIREDMKKRVMISYADVGKRYMAKLMARGEESFRQSRQVLRRRLCNPRDYSAVFPISSPDAVYTTSMLIETFSPPSYITNRLRSNPSTKPEDTNWGWLAQTESSTVTLQSNKIEEVNEWAFAAWPAPGIYNFIS